MLRTLIFIGLIMWGFFLAEQLLPTTSFGKMVDSAVSAERCKQYGSMVEGERQMDYRDRIRQFVRGCW